MTKYHISPETGRPNICRASVRACPIAGDNEHFATKDDARDFYESMQGRQIGHQMSKGGSKARTLKVGEEAKIFHYAGREENGIVVSASSNEGVIKDRGGNHWIVKMTKDGWQSDGRVMNPANRPIPDASSVKQNIQVPPGFTLTQTVEVNDWDNRNMEVLTLEKDGISIKIVFDGANSDSYFVASGHVSFPTTQGQRTFDRRGVEDSFYIDNPLQHYSDHGDPYQALNNTIKDFVDKKIPESQARIAGKEKLPGTSFLAGPEQKKTLREKGQVAFTPSGFGQGMVFSLKSAPGSKSASKEQKEFFGVNTLWFSTFDHD